ncbi:baseplate J/gp47 family protein [Escherichia albertii]|nr:baseplate J/gp47 family protein [Escherichia albertii]EJQ6148805.1 baseplate J/gp47 family protein [Escherichia albertii]
MAASQAIIDLSTIPVPDIVDIPDTESLVSQIVEKYTELDSLFSALVESDPAYKWAEALAFRVALVRQQINDAVRAVLLASACGADLDQIGANFQVQRMMITPPDDSTVPPSPAVYEDDDAFRERIQLSWARLSTAGAKNAYHYFAQSADPDVLDVKAYGPETHAQEGRVFLYVLSRTGDGTAPQPLLDKVAEAVNDDEIRPLTDFVSVRSAEIVTYDVVADIHIPYGLDGELVMESARQALQKYTDSVHRIGSVAARSGIDGALHQSGVITVVLHSPPADIVPQMGQAPWCRSVTLNKVETTDE